MTWYSDNKKRAYAQTKQNKVKYTARNVEIINNLRSNTPCTDCQTYYPYYVLDFDHIDNNKVDNVITLAYEPCGLEKLYAEIAKCEIVCANCHRQRTHDRKT